MRRYSWLPLSVSVLILMGFGAGAAFADPLYHTAVDVTDFTGTRVLGDPGLTGTGDWGTQPAPDASISWVITTTSTGYHYAYTVDFITGSTASGISHMLLELSLNCLDSDYSALADPNCLTNPKFEGSAIDPTKIEYNDWTSQQGNPGLPATIYGVKLNISANGAAAPWTYEFDSTRAPMWGDFYAKNGAVPKTKDPVINNAIWNTGILRHDTSTDELDFLPVPDTRKFDTPEPVSLVLLGAGLLGIGLLARKRR